MTTATLPRKGSRAYDEQLALYTDIETCPTDALTPIPLAKEPAFIAWQQDIPREYLHMSPEELDRRITIALLTAMTLISAAEKLARTSPRSALAGPTAKRGI